MGDRSYKTLSHIPLDGSLQQVYHLIVEHLFSFMEGAMAAERFDATRYLTQVEGR